ncbi:MAG: type II toxin-antitoxin system RelE/ParE family toxin [Oscillospiraceae bacterium]|nr:type II toxin-antitoxin system RelE/ParE family toxin [Oscillospiraceae bacterium]
MKLKINPRAFRDIAEIKSFICEEYNNPVAADRITNRIIKSYKQLEMFPYIGKRLNTIFETEIDYRFL